MKVLFSMLSTSYLRNYESVLRGLAKRGHRVRVLIHVNTGAAGGDALGQALLREHPELEIVRAGGGAATLWAPLALELRSYLDYLQFLDPRYGADYVKRADVRVPEFLKKLMALPPFTTATGRRLFAALLRLLENSIPSNPPTEDEIRSFAPDLVLFTPLLGLSTVQPDYLKSARALGLRTAFCVASWDNLSSKSALRLLPDAVLLWNEVQKQEAIELHGVPPERVSVTGAQLFDEWFERRPRPRAEFCRRVGLPDDKPFLLYLCSSPFKETRPEAEFVLAWLEALRQAPQPELRDIPVLVRPHPKRMPEWEAADLSRFGAVRVWPRSSGSWGVEEGNADYYDSMFHAAAVAGLNTSGFIESAIVGRPVHAVLAPDFAGSQQGTFHFHYLTTVAGGLLRLTPGFEEHFAGLAESVKGGDRHLERSRRFVEAFVRPQGLDRTATSVFLDRIEALAREAPRDRPWRVPPLLRPLGLALYHAASATLLTRHYHPLDWVALAFRDRGDRHRSVYMGARRLLAPRVLLRRRRAARKAAPEATLRIPPEAGFRVFEPGRFPEVAEIVQAAQSAARGVDPLTLKSLKPFMIGLLQERPLDAGSPFLRFALRRDVLASVSSYLGVAPVLTHVDVFYSARTREEESSSQLLHCDKDDVSQVKVFVLCNDVSEENGPLVILDAQTSNTLRRKLGYEYRNRVSDADALRLVGDAGRHAVTGPAGTVCFVDTSRCFHYGSRIQEGAPPRLVAMLQFLSPFSFMVSRDRRRARPFRRAVRPESSWLERLVLGAAR